MGVNLGDTGEIARAVMIPPTSPPDTHVLVYRMGADRKLIYRADLGFFTGYFLRKGFHFILAVLGAFAIQLPWLILTDIYLINMPLAIVSKLVIALIISDILWATIALFSYRKIQTVVK